MSDMDLKPSYDFSDEYENAIHEKTPIEHNEARMAQLELDNVLLREVRKQGERNGWNEYRIVLAQAVAMAAEAKMYEKIFKHHRPWRQHSEPFVILMPR